MIPFALTAHLPGGIVASRLDEVSLDGLLAYVVLRDQLGEDFWVSDPPVIEADLPLARRDYGDSWYWSVSRPFGTILARDIHYWHRRFEAQHEHFIDFAGKRGKIQTDGGPMKDARNASPILYLDALTWYAVGDPETVFDLVSELPFIGKGHGRGEGRVFWQPPTPLDEDRSVWSAVPANREWRRGWRRGWKTELMRPVPAEEALEVGGDFEFEYRVLRPPHWNRAAEQLCAVRGHAH